MNKQKLYNYAEFGIRMWKIGENRPKPEKEAMVHTLHHCYVKHFEENKTDFRIVQDLLVHKNSKTAEINTHVS